MKEKFSQAIRFIIMFLLIFIPCILFILIFVYRDFFNSLFMIIKLIFVMLPLILEFFILKYIFKHKFFTDALDKLVIKDAMDLEKYNTKNLSKTQGFYIEKNKYFGETKYYTRLNIVSGIILLLVASWSFVFSIMDLVEFKIELLVMLGCILAIIYNFFIRLIIISPTGIKSISIKGNQFIKWSKIKQIGISSPSGRSTTNAFSWVYVSTKLLSENIIINEDRKGVITFKFKNKLIHHILCHWDGEIVNLHNIKKWRRYIKR